MALVDAHTALFSADAMHQLGGAVRGSAFTSPGIVVTGGDDHTVVVSEVLPDSPAGDAGVGDVITAVNGAPPVSAWAQLPMSFVPEGTETTLAIVRQGETMQVRYAARAFEHPVGTRRAVGTVGILRPLLLLGRQGSCTELRRARARGAGRVRPPGRRRPRERSARDQGGQGPARFSSLFTDADPVLNSWRRWEDRDDPDAGSPNPWPSAHDAWPTRRPIAS